MSATVLAGLAVAGAVGAPARYLLDRRVAIGIGGGFPWGSFVVNVSGSLLLGLLSGAALHHALPATPTIWLGTGFCGAYTTFSSFTFETVRLLEEGATATALANVALTVVAGTLAAAGGLALAAIV